MISLIPQDEVFLKRLNASIKRVSRTNGIIFIGVNTQKLSQEFTNYLTEQHPLQNISFEREILRELADSKEYDKDKLYLVNIYAKKNQKSIIDS